MNAHLALRRAGLAMALAAAAAAGPARADLVLLGSDYFTTIQPTFFTPLGGFNPLAGLPIGPGATDTIVQRQQNCALSLSTTGSNCTIAIEMVALSLVSTVNPLVRVRESLTLASAGQMMIFSDGSGTGGTFNSFFDIFVDITLDGGANWLPQAQLTLTSSGTDWTTVEHSLLVDGLIGNQLANRHTDKAGPNCPVGPSETCVDFYLGRSTPGGIVGAVVTEQHPGVGVHTAISTPIMLIPEPGSLALVGLALAAMAGMVGHRRRPDGAQAA